MKNLKFTFTQSIAISVAMSNQNDDYLTSEWLENSVPGHPSLFITIGDVEQYF